MTDPRRLVPRTDTVLACPELVQAQRRLGRDLVKAAVVVAQQRVRDGQIAPDDVVAQVLAALPPTASSSRRVLNATGIIVHTNLGRAPLSPAALDAVAEAGGYTDVEFDLTTGHRARRGEGTLAALTEAVPAAGAVHVVNNNAAALLLTALELAQGKEIVLSRGELVEIGDGFRIPELLMSAGARLREVGTTNRTNVRDYAEAIGPGTGFVLKVHPSNFRVTGFTAAPDIAELTGFGVPLVADIGSGLLTAHPALPDEPDADSALRAGANLVTASGDKLLGGPQAGLMFGDAGLIERLRRNPAARALRVDKLTLAALEASVRGPVTPVRAALDVSPDDLAERAAKLAAGLAGFGARAVESVAEVGGGGAPGVPLPSAAVSLPRRFAELLRAGTPAVVGRVERDRCLLDLRAITPEQDAELDQAVRRCAS
ncbi:L-seryl-tRNA(Sec) selenium transferase [Amycolatopsis pithecellobii]|uniref:L-seryl-tRNA(Sec) selenium transferase n=1 Tax=Amycolatopsis pithecellobii TaxID=664692 RepID=A0A6N7YYG7_9PSEU|nr:L-seryl-tRNA(Sec) selenium transferase [Amycolatopsis pithecellobii]MTD53399.1 L-seryl-tRNA(Sec) selenium transferase [Amycolatopsis pithecellobii]